MKKEAKKQHWVPLFYLKYFAIPETRHTDNPQGWIFSKDEGDPFKVNLKDFTTKRYLYSPQDINGKRDWHTEDKLAQLEHLMSKKWQALAERFIDFDQNLQLRKSLSLFISTLLLRHPSNIDLTKEVYSKLGDFYNTLPKDTAGNPYIGKIIYEGKVCKFDHASYEEYKASGIYKFQRIFIDSLHSNATEFAEILMEKRWSIICSNVPLFITTDKPVVIENLQQPIFGLKTTGTNIFFPLSPTRLLVMDDRHDQPNGCYYQLGEHGPGPVNLILWKGAERFMISPRHTDDVRAEMKLFADKYGA